MNKEIKRKQQIVIIGCISYATPFQQLVGYNVSAIKECTFDPSDFEDAALVVFTGGVDVDPSMYNGERSPYAQYHELERDKAEALIFQHCLDKKIPMVGICRGSQFLNVMNGGTLIQHIEGHLGNHTMTTFEGEIVEVTSTHHQMMVVGEGGDVLAQAYEKVMTPERAFWDDIVQAEVVWYEKTHSLCVQYHPEYMPASSDGYIYFQKLIEEYLL